VSERLAPRAPLPRRVEPSVTSPSLVSPPVPRRLLTLLAVPLLALVAGAGCADDVSPAVRVGDVTLSDGDLMDEVAEWTGNEQAIPQTELAGLSPGTYPMRLVDAILQQRIDFELHEAKFDELGLTLDDDLRQQALLSLFQGDLASAQQALSGFSQAYAARYIDDYTRQLAVENALGNADYLAWRNEAYLETDIEVSPRYGRWDPEQQSVIGPDGPSQPEPAEQT
jgi:hypothetical protein